MGTGLAMGNACDEVRAVADEITLDNNSDGIAESLYRHLPEVFTN
ncbi:HAD hydrolase family protein [Treponema sp. JC4]|nr:HAD hydrolase family protein [Treponema sp. JC4]